MRDMLGRGSALEVPQALKIVLEAAGFLTPRTIKVKLSDAFGMVLAEDITCHEDIPGFTRTTVDGYAVRAADTFGASDSSPAYLNVTGEILMGEEPAIIVNTGEAVRIATGGMMPEGADAALMLEYAQIIDGSTIEATHAVAPGENIVQRGEDIKAGQQALDRGLRLRPQHVSVLASIGAHEVPVYERPRVAIISTGDEIVPPSSGLKPGQIRDSNSYLLEGLIIASGGVPVRMGTVRDEYEAQKSALLDALNKSDVVLITGGSSVGARDHAERVISELGEVRFHSVALKPGKPLLFGVLGGKPAFGLPGHPRAVEVTFEVFVRPALAVISGESRSDINEATRTVKAILTRAIPSASGRQEVFNVSLELRDGVLHATPILAKSGIISAAIKSHGSVIVPLGQPGLPEGHLADVLLV